MTEEQYFLIGFVIWMVGLIALPILVGYLQAKDVDPPEGFFFALAMFVVCIIPLWAFLIAGAIVYAIGYPIVRLLMHAGKKLAEAKP